MPLRKPGERRAPPPNYKPGRGKNSWIARANPDHPNYDPALREKYLATRAKAAEKRAKTNTGVPWGFTREDWDRRWQWRLSQADLLISHMEKTGMVETPEDGPEAEEKGYARESLKTAFAFVLEPKLSAKDRLAAASLVLSYTKSKPVQKTALAVSSAEDFLASIAEDAGI